MHNSNWLICVSEFENVETLLISEVFMLLDHRYAYMLIVQSTLISHL